MTVRNSRVAASPPAGFVSMRTHLLPPHPHNATVPRPASKPNEGETDLHAHDNPPHAGRLILAASLAIATPATAAAPNFVVAWAASAQGPYPVGNATAQPELRFAFPDATKGATDQSFRLIIRPDIWGKQARIRLSNAFGTKPVTFDAVYIGLQQSGSAILSPAPTAPSPLAPKPRSPSPPEPPPSATPSRCPSSETPTTKC